VNIIPVEMIPVPILTSINKYLELDLKS
jgi:hypothetical protein